MSPIIDLQRRFRELGRIRLGQKVTTKSGKSAPSKLSTFRLTSPSRDLIESAAARYGGEARPWQNNGAQEWEVVTEADVLDVVVPPGQVLSQFWELWSGGGCQKRCDGERELLTDSACSCPNDYDERREMATKGQACKPTTRLNVMLRALPDIGVWRLESHGYYAAVELAGTATILEFATKQGQMIPARLRLDPREVKRPGQTVNKFVVPIIEIGATFGQVAEALGVLPSPALATPPPMKALPEPEPAGEVPSATKPPLPRSPKGRTKVVLPAERPPLPADPSFAVEAALTMAEVPPPKPHSEDRAVQRAQQLHISARNSGVVDMLEDLVLRVTKERTRSTKEVSDMEAGELHQLFYELKTKRRQVTYKPDGTLVIS